MNTVNDTSSFGQGKPAVMQPIPADASQRQRVAIARSRLNQYTPREVNIGLDRALIDCQIEDLQLEYEGDVQPDEIESQWRGQAEFDSQIDDSHDGIFA